MEEVKVTIREIHQRVMEYGMNQEEQIEEGEKKVEEKLKNKKDRRK
jgi:hypothetical protein